MFGSRKSIIITILIFILTCPVFAENNEYSRSVVNHQYQEYMSTIREKIDKTWKPYDITETGHTVVVFKIDKNGEIISTEIRESSGNEFFDKCAVEAVRNGAPYGELPSISGVNNLTIMYKFDSSVAKMDVMKDYLAKSDEMFNRDNKKALEYANLALNEVRGDSSSYFIYARMSKIKRAMGDTEGALKDEAECQRLKAIFDQKRIKAAKLALTDYETPFGYFTLAQAYDIAGEYSLALGAIDKAISMTKLNNSYKRYREEIVEHSKK